MSQDRGKAERVGELAAKSVVQLLFAMGKSFTVDGLSEKLREFFRQQVRPELRAVAALNNMELIYRAHFLQPATRPCRPSVADSQRGGSLLTTEVHNKDIAIRKMGVERKLKINEYGVFEGRGPEAEVYAQVGLRYIEPELREDPGEIQAAQHNQLPKLVTLDQIRATCIVTQRAATGETPSLRWPKLRRRAAMNTWRSAITRNASPWHMDSMRSAWRNRSSKSTA
jgi:hypothetical protein